MRVIHTNPKLPTNTTQTEWGACMSTYKFALHKVNPFAHLNII